ncbi:MAG: LysR family transcriptional regulator [Magnetospirillum sp.]|nr:LysR family transcriptional regulator [Magnetospirillum sp.]
MRRDIDLSLLRTFQTVAATGSVTATGRRLLRTQPAISQRLRRLEDVVGTALLTRSHDRVGLTRAGEIVLAYAERMLALNDEIIDRLSGGAMGEVVRMGAPEEYGALPLDAIVRDFRKRNGTASLAVDQRLTGDLISVLGDGGFDVAVEASLATAARDHGAAKTVRMVWASRRPLMAGLGPAVPLVLFSRGSVYRQAALSALSAAGIRWEIVCESPRWPVVRSALEAGVGIAPLSADMVGEGMCVADERQGFPPLPKMTLSIALNPGASAAAQSLALILRESLSA